MVVDLQTATKDYHVAGMGGESHIGHIRIRGLVCAVGDIRNDDRVTTARLCPLRGTREKRNQRKHKSVTGIDKHAGVVQW